MSKCKHCGHPISADELFRRGAYTRKDVCIVCKRCGIRNTFELAELLDNRDKG